MNAFDLAIIGVIVLSGLFAFARGFVREALSIAAWVGAAAVTFYGFNYVYGLIFRFVATPLLAQLIAGAGLFIVSLILLTIFTGYIARFVQSSALSPIDRTLGLIFGLARGVVLVLLAYLVVDVSLPQNDRPVWIKEAKSERFLAKGADMLRGALPESLQIRSAAATDDTRRVFDRTQEAQRAMRALVSPAAPAAKSGEASTPNYKPAERREMDRLIENAR
jgi:membrane protein required for colicin V production